MQKNNIFSFVAALVIIAAFSLGCSTLQKIQERVAGGDNGNIKSEPGNPFGDSPNEPSRTEGDLLTKTNLYITKCFNNYSLRVTDSYRRYTSWIKDPKQGPTGNERVIYTLYKPNGDGSDCSLAIGEAKAMTPQLPEIEEIADRYSTALTETLAKINDIHSYYDQEDYKDDEFKKGKEAHPGLMAAFENFESVNKEFAAQIDILEDKVSNQQLEEFRGVPERQYEYAMIEFKMTAKKILRYVRGNEYDNLKAEELQPMIEELETRFEAVKKAKETRKSTVPDVSSIMFPNNAEQFIKAAKDLMRRIRDNRPFSDFDRRTLGTGAGWMIEGSPDQVIDRYNKLIRSF